MFGKFRKLDEEAQLNQLFYFMEHLSKRLDAMERSQETTHQYIKEIYRLLTKDAAISEKFDESVS